MARKSNVSGGQADTPARPRGKKTRGWPLAKKLEFWSRPDRSGCVLWIGYKDHKGYGRIFLNGRLRGAHRLSWANSRGAIPPGMFVLHKCDVPACINPDHLWLGTQADNVADMYAKGRQNRPFGEVHWKAKLRRHQVEDIRAAKGSRAAIAAMFGVSKSTVQRIKTKTGWTRV